MPLYIFCTDNSHPVLWKYRAYADTPAALKESCYDGNYSVPRNQYRGDLVEPATLRSCQTGDPTSGQIYVLSPLAELTASEDVTAKEWSRKLSSRSRNYMRRNAGFFFFSLMLLLCSCKPSKNLTGRYKTAVSDSLTNFSDSVGVKGFFLTIPQAAATAPVRPLNLPSNVQERLVKELGKDLNDPEKMIKLLGTPIISDNNTEPAIIYKCIYAKRLVLSIQNKSPFSENRIAKLEIGLKQPEGKITFTGCNRIGTEYQSVDQGKITFKNNVYGEVNAGGELGPSTSYERNGRELYDNGKGGIDTALIKTTANAASKTTIGGKLGFARETYEEANMKQRYISLSASVSENTVTFYQETVAGIDLSGNVIADVEFEVPSDKRETFEFYQFETVGKDEKQLAPDQVKMKKIYEVYPNAELRASSLRLKLSYKGVFRQVLSGGGTLIEGDDKIKLLRGIADAVDSVQLLSKTEMTPKQWYIKGDSETELLSYSRSKNEAPPKLKTIYFRDYFSAKAVLEWIQNTTINPVPQGSNAPTQGEPVQVGNEKIFFYIGKNLVSDANKKMLEINVKGL